VYVLALGSGIKPARQSPVGNHLFPGSPPRAFLGGFPRAVPCSVPGLSAYATKMGVSLLLAILASERRGRPPAGQEPLAAPVGSIPSLPLAPLCKRQAPVRRSRAVAARRGAGGPAALYVAQTGRRRTSSSAPRARRKRRGSPRRPASLAFAHLITGFRESAGSTARAAEHRERHAPLSAETGCSFPASNGPTTKNDPPRRQVAPGGHLIGGNARR
jgi:hypothetical protein